MPPLFALTIALLLLVPPCYGVALILLDTHTPPRLRSTRALGGTFLCKTAITAGLILLGVLVEGQKFHPLSLLVMALPVIAVVRVMQNEGQNR